MVPTIIAALVLVAVKFGRLPVPLAARPIKVLVLVQVYVAPVGVVVNVGAVYVEPGHKLSFTIGVTTGSGLTAMV